MYIITCHAALKCMQASDVALLCLCIYVNVCRYAEMLVLLSFIVLALLWFLREPRFIPGWGDLFPQGENGNRWELKTEEDALAITKTYHLHNIRIQINWFFLFSPFKFSSFVSDGTTAIFIVFLLFILPSLPCIPFAPTRRRPPDSE